MGAGQLAEELSEILVVCRELPEAYSKSMLAIVCICGTIQYVINKGVQPFDISSRQCSREIDRCVISCVCTFVNLLQADNFFIPELLI